MESIFFDIPIYYKSEIVTEAEEEDGLLFLGQCKGGLWGAGALIPEWLVSLFQGCLLYLEEVLYRGGERKKTGLKCRCVGLPLLLWEGGGRTSLY